MQLYTVAGALMLVMSALDCARRLNRNTDRNISLIDGYIALLRFARMQIDCYALPVDEIFKRCDRDMLSSCGYDCDELPSEFVDFFEKLSINDKTVGRIVFEFCSDFGKHYREEQLKRCDACISELETVRDKLRSEAKNSKKLCLTLCLSGAIALIIVLI